MATKKKSVRRKATSPQKVIAECRALQRRLDRIISDAYTRLWLDDLNQRKVLRGKRGRDIPR